jgi:membrane AbrB-like protein
MSAMVDFFLFYAIGIAGWLIFEKLRLPSPAILGSILFLALISFFGVSFTLPTQLKPSLSMVLGIILGLRFNFKNTITAVKEIILVAVWLAVLTFAATSALTATGVDKATSLFASAPGGITEITLISMSFGANSFAVALLQLTRMLVTLLVISFGVRDKPKIAEPPAPKLPEIHSAGQKPGLRVFDWFALAVLGAGSAWGCTVLDIPAGAMVGPMLTVGVYANLRRLQVNINKPLQKLIQVGVGGMVGLSVTRESIMSLPTYIVPILCLDAIIVGGSFVLALVLQKITKWGLPTCILSTAPGGMSLTILVAVDKDADADKVATFQVLRMILVLLLMPFFGKLVL